MRIRTLIATAIAVSAWSACAQAPEAASQIKPYLQVKPVAGDEEVIRVYFSPSCSFSKAYLQFFKNLGATIPRTKSFEFTPLVNRGDGMAYALAFEAVRTYYPAYVTNFVEASLVGVQDRGLSPRTWPTIEQLGRAARIPASLPRLVKQHSAELEAKVLVEVRRQKALEITNTPAVAVGGTYIVTPEFTNGDAAMFSQLVNGVISMSN